MEIEYSASWICVFTAQISSPSSPAVCWRPLQQRLQHLKFIIVTAETRNSIPGHPFSVLHPLLLLVTALHTVSPSQSTCFILSLTPSPRWSPVLCGIFSKLSLPSSSVARLPESLLLPPVPAPPLSVLHTSASSYILKYN